MAFGEGGEHLEYVVSLRGGMEAAADLERVAGAARSVGGSMRQMGSESHTAAGHVSRLTGGMKGLIGTLGVAGAAYGAYGAAKNALNFTHELAEGTSTLNKATGMSVEVSSRWIGVANVLGVRANAVGTTFSRLAAAVKTQIEAGGKSEHATDKHSAALDRLRERQQLALKVGEEHAAEMKGEAKAQEYMIHLREKQALAYRQAVGKEQEAGGGGKAAPLETLGISTAFLKAHAHDMSAIMLEVVDRLGKLHGGVDKAAVMTRIFGRSWQSLSPLLLEGRAHLEGLLGAAQKFGVELHGNVTEKIDEYRKAQLDAKLAADGLRLGFSELAMGPLSELLKLFASLEVALRTGEWGTFQKNATAMGEKVSQILDKAVPKLAETAFKLAPIILTSLWRGFTRASIGGEAIMGLLIASKLGLTGAIFGGLGKALMARFGAGMAANTAAAEASGAAVGTTWGKAFVATALAFGIYKVFSDKNANEEAWDTIFGGYTKREEAEKASIVKEQNDFRKAHPPKVTPLVKPRSSNPAIRSAEERGAREGREGSNRALFPTRTHGALGGTMRGAGMVEVGEYGPETLSLPQGSSIAPLAPGAMQSGDVVVQIDGREIVRQSKRQLLQAQAAGAS